jgi:hypothetical protein
LKERSFSRIRSSGRRRAATGKELKASAAPGPTATPA